jgi:glycosyltransferase involved in cell wall biosynthesis
MSTLRIAVVTPVRDEEGQLERLVAALAAQTLAPSSWTIVDTGSTDGTPGIAHAAARLLPWAGVLSVEAPRRMRGAPIVRAIEAAAGGLAGAPPDLLINIDADVSFDPGFLAGIADAFAADPSLGIASGTCLEHDGRTWSERHVTGSSAWGATRAYRWQCFQDVRPLEPRFGWDGIDELRAQARGWSTRTLRHLPFRHHRREGACDAAWRAFAAQGATAHYMGYRPSYLLLRAAHHARRRPVAVAMVGGFAARALTRRPRLADDHARTYLRRQQRLRCILRRAREATGASTA